ncbi:hypothetical protein ACH5RR_029245 [Cinchona calisaya]|uniref:Uncharacterized protein n=1 Tax=Cinchona calisaya TaxID=153742 RepID=A0ABD2YUI5_9GENT
MDIPIKKQAESSMMEQISIMAYSSIFTHKLSVKVRDDHCSKLRRHKKHQIDEDGITDSFLDSFLRRLLFEFDIDVTNASLGLVSIHRTRAKKSTFRQLEKYIQLYSISLFAILEPMVGALPKLGQGYDKVVQLGNDLIVFWLINSRKTSFQTQEYLISTVPL